MAGLFGNTQGGYGGGILAGAQQQTQPWQGTLGILASALKDATNSFSGRGDTDNLQNWNATRGQADIRQQLIAGLTSTDPQERQKAYALAPILGVDPSAFQKQQASQALPQLLTAMQPTQVSAPAAQGDAGEFGKINVPALPIGTSPGMGISEALSSVNNPELTAQYGPDLVKARMTADADAAKPFDLSPGQHRFQGGQDIASLPEKNDPNKPFNIDGTPNKAYQSWKQQDQISGRAPVQPRWQILSDPKSGNQYRYNVDSGAALTLDGKPYTPAGASKIGGGMARSPAAAYINSYMEAHPGATPDEISKAAAGFRMGQSEGGTIGTRSGAADVASAEVSVFAKQALDASNNMPRSEYEAMNSVLQSWDMKTKNPALRRLMIASDALVNARARAISPTGSPHVNDQLEGRKMLSAAFASGDYQAAVDQMQMEAEGVKSSTKASQDHFMGRGDDKPKAPISTTGLPRLPQAGGAKIRVFNPATGRLE